MRYSADQVLAAMAQQKHEVFRGEWNINLVGIRSTDVVADTFNDYICVLFEHLRRWEMFAFPATTDPGLFYRNNPLVEQGVAILKPGQYRGCWEFGKHRGQYDALVQRGVMAVYRDANHDDRMDTDTPVDIGHFGINMHRASVSGASFVVGKWSAGCQVVRAPWDFDLIMAICRRSAVDWGAKFSYTLLNESDVAQA